MTAPINLKKNRQFKTLFLSLFVLATLLYPSAPVFAADDVKPSTAKTNDRKYGYVRLNSTTADEKKEQDAQKKAATQKKAPKRKTSAPAVDALPWRSDSALRIAETQIVSGKYAHAIQTLKNVLNRHPGNADAYAYTGYAQMRLGLDKKSKKSLRHALSLDAKHMGAHLYIGLMHLKEDKVAQAVERLAALRAICKGALCGEEDYLADQVNAYKKAKAEKTAP